MSAAVGRFDGFLADTRKYGFTLVTVLLTANALVPMGNPSASHEAASIVVMALLLALFMLDNYYWVLVRAAVKQADKLEGPGRISSVIGDKAKVAHATGLIVAMYSVFVLVAIVMGADAVFTAAPVAVGGLIALSAAVLVEVVAMFAVFVVSERDSGVSVWFRNSVVWKSIKNVLRTPRADPPDVPA